VKITIIANRELTAGEQFAIDKFSYYFNNQKTFAVVGDNTVIAITKQAAHDEIIEICRQSMQSLLNTHPDFSSYIMDDGNVMVGMLYDVLSVIDGQKAGLLPTDKKVPVNIALAARSHCLMAAKNCSVVAIIEPDKSTD